MPGTLEAFIKSPSTDVLWQKLGAAKRGGNAVKEDNRPKSRSLRVTKSRKFQSREGLKCRLMYSPSFKFPLTKRAIDIYPYM